MTCLNCETKNRFDSLHCTNCGKILERKELNKKRSFSQEIADADDVIFLPKKKNSNGLAILIIIAVIFIVFWLLYAIGYSESPTSTSTSETVETLSQDSLLNRLSITNYDLIWDEQELYFTGTLHNANDTAARNVRVRLDFYWDQAETDHFDTRTVSISGVDENGAFSFQLPLTIYPQEKFWWSMKIVDAEEE